MVRKPARANHPKASREISGQPFFADSSNQTSVAIRQVTRIDMKAPPLRLLPSWPRTTVRFVRAKSVIDNNAKNSPIAQQAAADRQRLNASYVAGWNSSSTPSRRADSPWR